MAGFFLPASRADLDRTRPQRDAVSSYRHPASGYSWSMMFSENRHPLFGIML
jgi:hypothetical protein